MKQNNRFYPSNQIGSYMILAPNEMKVEPDERKASKICLETIKLEADLYRIGHTKARKSEPHSTSSPSPTSSTITPKWCTRTILLTFIKTFEHRWQEIWSGVPQLIIPSPHIPSPWFWRVTPYVDNGIAHVSNTARLDRLRFPVIISDPIFKLIDPSSAALRQVSW